MCERGVAASCSSSREGGCHELPVRWQPGRQCEHPGCQNESRQFCANCGKRLCWHHVFWLGDSAGRLPFCEECYESARPHGRYETEEDPDATS